MTRSAALVLALALALVAAIAGACSSFHGEGVDVARLPADVRDDYAVFAQRCSKCHSLARPLGSGIDDDDYWRWYVERMRRQPSSGISPADEVPILRFLHYYSETQKNKKSRSESL